MPGKCTTDPIFALKVLTEKLERGATLCTLFLLIVKRLRVKKVKVWFYIALYPVRWTAQSANAALHFPPLADLFIPTPFSASLGSQVLIYTAESTEAS